MTSEIQTKEPSEKLQELIVKVGDVYSEALTKFKDVINEALEQGRREGFNDLQIGDMLRGEQRRRQLLGQPVYTRQTLALSLPASAKHMSKARTGKTANVLEESGKTFYQNQEEEGDTIWQIKPQDYNINDVEYYDKSFLVRLVRYLHDCKYSLEKQVLESGGLLNYKGIEKEVSV